MLLQILVSVVLGVAMIGVSSSKSLGEELYEAVGANDEAECERLIQQGANLNWTDNSGYTALQLAAEKGKLAVAKLLIDAGAELDAEDLSNYTSLHKAALNNHKEICNLLLIHGANINLQNNGGRTSLHFAAGNDNQDICALLLSHGANINLQDNVGRTPLHYAVSNGHQEICALLLIHGANINLQDNAGHTPLQFAAANDHQAICGLLLDNGAKINLQDNDGDTPLHKAAYEGRREICALLLHQGANTNLQNKAGNTALMSAVRSDISTLVVLLQWGTDVSIRNHNGKTVLDLAVGQSAIQAILEEPYCDPFTLPVQGEVTSLTTTPGKSITITCPYGDTIQVYSLMCRSNRTWDGTIFCNPDGCKNGTFGENCSSVCGHCSNNTTCDKVSGTCPDKCESGYYGLLCWQRCHCASADTCDRQTGKCPNECAAGFLGDKCDQGCDDGTYGDKCASKCAHCRTNMTCDKVRGTCPDCEPGYFGLKCVDRCGHCAPREICHSQTGACASGCTIGYHGDNCDKGCDDGTYGDMCASKCAHCSTNTTCEKVRGTCPDCKPGYFGLKCDDRCGHCARKEICDSQTGTCPSGCALGYNGDKCDEDTYKWMMIISAVLFPLIVLGCCASIFLIIVRKRKHRAKQQNTIEIPLEEIPLEENKYNFLSQLKDMDLELYEKVIKLNIEPERVEIGKKVLGKGNFGAVYKGTYNSVEGQTPIAVKTLKGNNPSPKEYSEFLEEATMMMEFHHENILTLYGVMILENRPYVILPFMENGDLRTYLLNPSNKITQKDGLHFGLQIAKGMSYLAHMKCVHRDLAARNCMIDGNQLVKIGDFGLARDIYEKEYYKIDDLTRPLPQKWMAIESLEWHIFSTKSDVWSYGVTLWEIMTRGILPYPDIAEIHLKGSLQVGKRMDQPPFCPDQIYELMRNCWQKNPKDRPAFLDIQKFLEEYLDSVDITPREGITGTKNVGMSKSRNTYLEPVDITPREGFTATKNVGMANSRNTYLEPVDITLREGFTATTHVGMADSHDKMIPKYPVDIIPLPVTVANPSVQVQQE